MIDQIVSRCHVGQSNRQVIKYFRSRLKCGAWSKLSREQRKDIIRQVIQCHSGNQDLYRAVVSGRI
jgi:hypothetical protein